jgi:hypothetical protein
MPTRSCARPGSASPTRSRTEEEQFAKTLENGMKLFEAGAKT